MKQNGEKQRIPVRDALVVEAAVWDVREEGLAQSASVVPAGLASAGTIDMSYDLTDEIKKKYAVNGASVVVEGARAAFNGPESCMMHRGEKDKDHRGAAVVKY